MMSTIELTKFISAVGFPVAVCIWLLYERWKLNYTLVATLQKQTDILERLERVLELQRASGN